MVDKTKFIWFDGELVPWDEANVHVLTHSLHYGVGVFEGIRAYKLTGDGSCVFRLHEHMDRMFRSARVMQMNLPYTQEEMEAAIISTMTSNGMAAGYIRPLAFVGLGNMGVYPGNNPIHVIVATWPWGAYLGDEALHKGIRVRTSSFTRHHVNVMMTKCKVPGNYVNSVLAKREALADGYDEAVMLDAEGYVSEATGENIFLVRNGKLKTTPMTSILGGITRDCIVTLARDLGYEVTEERFSRDEMYMADEVFFTGTAAELTPVREVDNRPIGIGHAGPVALKLQEEFFKVVKGENSRYESWLYRYNV